MYARTWFWRLTSSTCCCRAVPVGEGLETAPLQMLTCGSKDAKAGKSLALRTGGLAWVLDFTSAGDPVWTFLSFGLAAGNFLWPPLGVGTHLGLVAVFGLHPGGELA